MYIMATNSGFCKEGYDASQVKKINSKAPSVSQIEEKTAKYLLPIITILNTMGSEKRH